MLLSIVQFILGMTLVAVVSAGCPPKPFCLRLLNLACAIPGAVAISTSVVPAGGIDPYLLTITVAVILVLYATGKSTENYLKE